MNPYEINFTLMLNEEEIVNKLSSIIKDSLLDSLSPNRQEYNPSFCNRLTIIVLESSFIMITTNNVDTLIGRYSLLLNRVGELMSCSCNDRYNSDMQESLDKYKLLYYERIPLEEQIKLIREPERKNLNYILLQNAKRTYNYTATEYNKIFSTSLKKRTYEARVDKLFKIIHQLKYCCAGSYFETKHFFEYLEKAENKINGCSGENSMKLKFETFDEDFKEHIIPMIKIKNSG